MPTQIDESDTKIVTLLQGDGRLPNTKVAKLLGLSEATVRKRVDRLLREEIIQIGAWVDPLKVGFEHYAIIELQVRLKDIERAAKQLASMDEIFFLGICTGSHEIFSTALFRSNDHLHHFITTRLSKVSGIQRTSIGTFTRIVKRAYDFRIEWQATPERPSRRKRRRKRNDGADGS